MEKVNRIIRVNISINKENSHELEISVMGTFNSIGYSNAQLVPHYYEIPPSEGIFDFDFVADEPAKEGEKQTSLILAEYKWNDYPQNLTAIRIHSETSFVERSMLHLIQENNKIFEEVKVS